MQTSNASDAPLTATLGETVQYKIREGSREADALWGLEPERYGWRELLRDSPYVALGAAVAVGITVTLLMRRR